MKKLIYLAALLLMVATINSSPASAVCGYRTFCENICYSNNYSCGLRCPSAGQTDAQLEIWAACIDHCGDDFNSCMLNCNINGCYPPI